ncbi:MAG TPA: hypothetical protein VLL27_02820 [Solirubrobacterales bacterium]|nr:hypothetical protein [Solirubrobacterales bacterium]
MKTRTIALFLAVALAAAAFVASAGAAMVGIYRNSMDSTAQRAQLIKLAGASCARGGSDSALKIAVGEKTEACSFRAPVLGRDLEIAATERLLSGTPTALQRRAYLGLELRAGAGAKYQMLVYPLQRKVQLVKVTPEGTKFLAIVKNQAMVKGVNKANALRLRAVNVASGPEKGSAKISGFLGSTRVVEATDAGAGELTGRAATVTVGGGKNADGLLASVDDLIIRVPSPF